MWWFILYLLPIVFGGSNLNQTEINLILSLHNADRSRFCSPPLVWNDTAANVAKNYASKCLFQHNPARNTECGQNCQLGENIAAGPSSSISSLYHLWSAEEKSWSCPSGVFSDSTGHWTQIVWSGTTSVGCGFVSCPSIGNFLVCDYSSAGNIQGQNAVSQCSSCAAGGGSSSNLGNSGNSGGGSSVAPTHAPTNAPAVLKADPGVAAASPGTFQQTILDLHNADRQKFCSPPLVWNAQAATVAQNYASKCVFAHNANRNTDCGCQLGENIASGTGQTTASLYKLWQNEQSGWTCPSGVFSASTGHWTQIIWSGTTSVGCAQVDCPSLGQFLVCDYSGPGNVQGQNSVTQCSPCAGGGGSTSPTPKAPPPVQGVQPKPVPVAQTGSSGGACVDTVTGGWKNTDGSPINCAQEASLGRCNSAWASAPNCQKSCGRCGTTGGTTTQPKPVPVAPTASSGGACVDAVTGGWKNKDGSPINCAQEASLGRCNSAWASAPNCNKSCGRCKSGARLEDESAEQSDSGSSGNKTPIIIGVVVGGVLLLIIVVVIVGLIVRSRRARTVSLDRV